MVRFQGHSNDKMESPSSIRDALHKTRDDCMREKLAVDRLLGDLCRVYFYYISLRPECATMTINGSGASEQAMLPLTLAFLQLERRALDVPDIRRAAIAEEASSSP